MMRKLDEILSGSNRENRSDPTRDSHWAFDESGTHKCAGEQPRFEPDHRERPRAAPSMSGWTDPAAPEARATQEHVYRQCQKSDQCHISLPSRRTRRCTIQCLSVWIDLLKHLSPNSGNQLREKRGHVGHSKSQNHTRMSQMAASTPG